MLHNASIGSTTQAPAKRTLQLSVFLPDSCKISPATPSTHSPSSSPRAAPVGRRCKRGGRKSRARAEGRASRPSEVSPAKKILPKKVMCASFHGASGGEPSRGSRNHHLGKCRPCRDFAKDQACPDGHLCNFCHFPHDEPSSTGRSFDRIGKGIEFEMLLVKAHCEKTMGKFDDLMKQLTMA